MKRVILVLPVLFALSCVSIQDMNTEKNVWMYNDMYIQTGEKRGPLEESEVIKLNLSGKEIPEYDEIGILTFAPKPKGQFQNTKFDPYEPVLNKAKEIARREGADIIIQTEKKDNIIEMGNSEHGATAIQVTYSFILGVLK